MRRQDVVDLVLILLFAAFLVGWVLWLSHKTGLPILETPRELVTREATP